MNIEYCLGSDSEGSDIDLDLALLQRLEKIEGREAEQDRKQIQEEEEKVAMLILKSMYTSMLSSKTIQFIYD